jgi:hypothetical protein
MSNTFFLFAYEQCYPNGGIEDCVGAFATLDDAKSAIVGLKIHSDLYIDEMESGNDYLIEYAAEEDGSDPDYAHIATLLNGQLLIISKWDREHGWSDNDAPTSDRSRLRFVVPNRGSD